MMTDILLHADGNILLFIQDHIRQSWMDGFWTLITHLGDAGLIWIALAVILLFPKKTRWTGAAMLLALAIGALITNAALKNIIARTRPYEVISELVLMIGPQSDFSFPSGHTCASFAAAYAMYRMSPGKWSVAALILAGLIAFSRLYVGVHYPSDVLGGLLVGILSGWCAWKLMEMAQIRQKEKQ